MVGGPVFGPKPRLKQAAFIIAAISVVVMLVLAIAGCAKQSVEYRPIPEMLVPSMPRYESVKSDELMCLSDSTYEKIARNFISCKQHVDELRALLGVKR